MSVSHNNNRMHSLYFRFDWKISFSDTLYQSINALNLRFCSDYNRFVDRETPLNQISISARGPWTEPIQGGLLRLQKCNHIVLILVDDGTELDGAKPVLSVIVFIR